MIYVDPLMTATWRFKSACHLLADDIKELHKFAQRLGLKRSWFQSGKGKSPHYDLTANKRKLAVKLGAVELTRRETISRLRRK